MEIELKKKMKNKDDIYYNFLTILLDEISKSPQNLKAVYPVLQENLNLLDESLVEITKKTLTEMLVEAFSQNYHYAHYMGKLVFLLGDVFKNFPEGKLLEKIEITIHCYESLLLIWTIDSSSELWALTQYILGNLYSKRLKGNQMENIESAIQYYMDSLSILTPEEFPELSAIIYNNIGNLYSKRLKGHQMKNIELAIIFYKKSLYVFTKEDFPEKWAIIQYNLNNVYTQNKNKKIIYRDLAIQYNPTSVNFRELY